ncbi:MAG: cobalamin-independent methionine synthase II family protein [Gammaproteobacteria bacterium]|nr:cobalamin-independent methionine synthase II family protein [Gammaproteobacteria bacterium]
MTSRKIKTTHVGSLPRPQWFLDTWQYSQQETAEQDKSALKRAVKEVVDMQAEIGLDIVNDGEMSKPTYATYITSRLNGFSEGDQGKIDKKAIILADLGEYPEVIQRMIETGSIDPNEPRLCCTGKVTPSAASHSKVMQDLDCLQSALQSHPDCQGFMSAASPGVISVFQQNQFYETQDAYLEDTAEAMRLEYEAIVNAGLILQLDCPDLAMNRHLEYSASSDDEFVKSVSRNIEVLNHATRNIPAEQMRMHVCWGNYEGPHHRDIPLRKIIATVIQAKPAGLLIECANPRHAHEAEVFEKFKLPDDKYLVPGVIDTCTNYVEHPDLVAQRILRFVALVGMERVLAGTDCGFATFAKCPSVFPRIAEAKLHSLVKGAQIASEKLSR